jgi:hypothetical protein
MPAVPEPYDALAAHIDSLVGTSRLHPRRPAVDYTAMPFNAPPKPAPAKRQQMTIQQGIIPTYYNVSGPAPGTVVGIVLGSVAGFLLIVWLLYTLTQGGGRGGGGTTAMAGQEEIIVRRPRRNSQGANRSRVSRRTEMREVSRSPRRSGGRSQIIVEERHRVPGDDVVEVIEEHEEFRERRGSGRRGGYR